MSSWAPYTVLILDADDCELSNTEYDSKREAISMAREKIGPATSDYQDWRQAQVRRCDGVIVWDKQRSMSDYCKVCGEHHAPACTSDDLPEPGDIRETG